MGILIEVGQKKKKKKNEGVCAGMSGARQANKRINYKPGNLSYLSQKQMKPNWGRILYHVLIIAGISQRISHALKGLGGCMRYLGWLALSLGRQAGEA